MTSKDSRPAAAAKLRRQAEEAAREKAAESPEARRSLSPEETRRMLHELQVHQIELETQNEELRRAQAELDAARARYFDLYDLAPVGYCTLSEEGLILEANLMAATLLGGARGALVKQPITRFILPEDQDIYYHHRKQIIETGEPQACDLRTLRADAAPFWVRLESNTAQDADGAPVCRVALSDITERKRAEEALRESNQWLHEAQRLAHIGAWDWKADTDTVTWTEDLYCIAGLDPMLPAPTYAEHSAIYAPESWEALKAAVERAMETGEPYQLELELIRPDGNTRHVNAHGGAKYDTNGRVNGLHGVVQDITERKRAEEALRESEKELSLTLDVTTCGIYKWNFKTNALFFSSRYYTMLGYDPGEFPATYEAWKSLIHPDDLPGALRVSDDWLGRQSDLYENEFRLRTKAGGYRWISARSTVVERDKRGNAVRMIGNHEDITERKLAEQAVRESEARYRRITKGLTDYLYSVRVENGRAVETTQGPACAAVTGYTAEEFAGDRYLWLRMVAPEDRELVRSRAQEVLAGKEIPPIEHRILRKDGETRWVCDTTILHKDASGNILSYDGIIKDITERKRAEEGKAQLEGQLQQAQKMDAVGRLAGGVAHDFNNMLQVILMGADMALSEAAPGSPLAESLQEIRKAGQRSADLTRQLLAFARKQIIAPRVLDLNDTVAGILKMLGRLIGEDIDLLWKPGNDLQAVKMDPGQIDQILANLVVNARDAITGVGKVTIETGKAGFDQPYCDTHPGFTPGQYVLLGVSDDGCGMSKETLANIFEPFFTTKESGKGTGLGLATVYGIVKQNNGYINVDSEPGKGTTFKIYLPPHEAEAAAGGEKRESLEPATGTETVLLVEDQEALLTLCRRLLERLGYTVLPAGSPQEAIRLVEEHAGDIHLLITDIVMPEMSGGDLCQRLKALRPGMKCLFMSGYTANVIAHRAILEEGVHFLQKPFSMEALAAKVREALSA